MIAFPNCKINIGLYVTEKRSDGYHNLETCFLPLPWHDVLEVLPSNKMSMEFSGIPIPSNGGDNLVLKAYELLKKDHDLPPVAIYLHKCIPMGAGLGGGSSDASAMLLLLNMMFDLNISLELLEKYALNLGSDCPIFIKNQPTIAYGRGEIFENISLKLVGKYIAVTHPRIHISTAGAFKSMNPRLPNERLRDKIQRPMVEWKETIGNDFEEYAFSSHPEIGAIKEEMYKAGALYASLSGSGSAVYGIFDNKPELDWPKNYISKLIQI
jgi:4-diphosphocytidyl-2-C-methyl-D-erythritol kinase